MSDHHGKFVWYELMTSNIKAAAGFYTGVIGWTAKDSNIPGMDYTMFNAGEAGVGGMMTIQLLTGGVGYGVLTPAPGGLIAAAAAWGIVTLASPAVASPANARSHSS